MIALGSDHGGLALKRHIIAYLEEAMTTQNRQASLRERFRIMARHYGLMSTVAHHAWFVLRAVIKK